MEWNSTYPLGSEFEHLETPLHTVIKNKTSKQKPKMYCYLFDLYLGRMYAAQHNRSFRMTSMS